MKKPKLTEPKDIGLKFGTEEESFWAGIREKTENELKTLEKMVKFNQAILELAIQKIEAEVLSQKTGP